MAATAVIVEVNATSGFMQKEEIIEKLKANGCRITKQRQVLLDVILQEECTSCKEIYYQAAKKDSTIGPATVYRLLGITRDYHQGRFFCHLLVTEGRSL